MAVEQSVILVVDDNEMNRDMLSRRLQRQGHQVEIAEDGIVALEMIGQRPFDLVLLDIMMPRMTGYEVLEKVKGDPATQHVPVIMISAVDDLESVVRCIEIGADDYLFKPFNPILLKARVGSSLEKKRLYDKERQSHQQGNSAADAEANKVIVRHFFEAVAKGNVDSSLITSDFKLIEQSQRRELSLEQMGQELRNFVTVNPKFQLSIGEMIAEKDQVLAVLTLQPDTNISATQAAFVSKIDAGKIFSQAVFSANGWLGVTAANPA